MFLFENPQHLRGFSPRYQDNPLQDEGIPNEFTVNVYNKSVYFCQANFMILKEELQHEVLDVMIELAQWDDDDRGPS